MNHYEEADMMYHGRKMETIHPEGCVAMTWADAERMEKRNEANGWGFGMADCLRMLADHMDADEARNEVTDDEKFLFATAKMEKIEWRLEDANFHTFHKMLHDGEYVKALAWIAKEYCEMEVV